MVKQRKTVALLIGLVVVLLLALMGGVVLAQTATPEAPAQRDDAAPDLLRGLGAGLLGHGFGLGRHGDFGSGRGDSDRDENLAEALGITVEELAAARAQAFQKSLADAVAAGQLTQEQADQILAMQALKSYIDRQALLAEALGMTADELQAALDEGQTLWDLTSAREISPSTLQTNMRAAYEAAIARAVADGVITQAQADDILSAETSFGPGPFGGQGGHGGRGRHHGHGGMPGFWSAPSDTDTSSGAADLDA